MPFLGIGTNAYESYADSSSESHDEPYMVPSTPEVSYAEFDGNTMEMRAEVEPSSPSVETVHSLVTLNLDAVADTADSDDKKRAETALTPPPGA